MKLRIAGIDPESVVDGPGIRLVVFTQGCPHRCPGCHNPQTHDPGGGYERDIDEIQTVIENSKLIRGVTFSGGEPFLQATALAELARWIRAMGFDVVAYTGYLFEDLLIRSRQQPDIRELLKHTDILIDGPYQAEERDTRLAFRGSRNQRIIDVPKSLRTGRTILWVDDNLRQLANLGKQA